MKKRMVAKMDMYLQVKVVIHKHGSSWSGMSAFDTAYTNFKDKLVELQSLSYGQENATLGVSSNKNDKREEAIAVALEVLGGLRAFASSIGSTELKEQTHITLSTLRKSSKLELVQLLDRILEKANNHLGELAGFGIDSAKVVALQTLRDEVGIAINLPRTAIIDRKTITLSIGERFEELDTLLKEQLDMLILVLKKQHPLFFKDYMGARVIIDPKVAKKNKGTNPAVGDDGIE